MQIQFVSANEKLIDFETEPILKFCTGTWSSHLGMKQAALYRSTSPPAIYIIRLLVHKIHPNIWIKADSDFNKMEVKFLSAKGILTMEQKALKL